eukprot:9467768-Ditylum_brightwellii.AAC.1
MENYVSRKQNHPRRKGYGMVQAPQERGRIRWDVLPKTTQSRQVGGKGKKNKEARCLKRDKQKLESSSSTSNSSSNLLDLQSKLVLSNNLKAVLCTNCGLSDAQVKDM